MTTPWAPEDSWNEAEICTVNVEISSYIHDINVVYILHNAMVIYNNVRIFLYQMILTHPDENLCSETLNAMFWSNLYLQNLYL
jgi:hypothetical protein